MAGSGAAVCPADAEAEFSASRHRRHRDGTKRYSYTKSHLQQGDSEALDLEVDCELHESVISSKAQSAAACPLEHDAAGVLSSPSPVDAAIPLFMSTAPMSPVSTAALSSPWSTTSTAATLDYAISPPDSEKPVRRRSKRDPETRFQFVAAADGAMVGEVHKSLITSRTVEPLGAVLGSGGATVASADNALEGYGAAAAAGVAYWKDMPEELLDIAGNIGARQQRGYGRPVVADELAPHDASCSSSSWRQQPKSPRGGGTSRRPAAQAQQPAAPDSPLVVKTPSRPVANQRSRFNRRRLERNKFVSEPGDGTLRVVEDICEGGGLQRSKSLETRSEPVRRTSKVTFAAENDASGAGTNEQNVTPLVAKQMLLPAIQTRPCPGVGSSEPSPHPSGSAHRRARSGLDAASPRYLS
jgi:hypothetical protein